MRCPHQLYNHQEVASEGHVLPRNPSASSQDQDHHREGGLYEEEERHRDCPLRPVLEE